MEEGDWKVLHKKLDMRGAMGSKISGIEINWLY
jgi:hypothetical protein